MKRKFLFVLIISVALFSSCKRTWESMRRGIQASDRHYEIKQYSGGKLIGTYKFKGILNNSENSDGYYFYLDNKLIEVSGDLIIISTK